jgi:chromosome segregation ATPase
MADPRKRADVTSRIAAPDAWDAGLHAESDAGPIDVGLSVEPSAVGLIVDAPGIGQLKVAFDLAADGTTKLARASRRLADGRDAPLIAIDEAKVLQLEGELLRLKRTLDGVQKELGEQIGHLTTERDEARDRAAILSDERKEQREDLERSQRKLSEATAALQTEKESRLSALSDRDKARAELDRVREELDAGSALVMKELSDARAGKEAAESERGQLAIDLDEARAHQGALEGELAEVRKKLSSLEDQLASEKAGREAGEAAAQELEAARAKIVELEETASRYVTSESMIAAERNDARARMAEVEEQLREEMKARELALTTERTERQRLELDLEQLQASHEEDRLKLQAALEAERGERSRAAEEVETLRAQVANAEVLTANVATLQAELDAARAAGDVTALQQEVEALRAQVANAEVLTANVATLQAEVDALRTQLALAEAAAADAATLQSQLTSLEADLARRDDSLRAAMERGDALQAQLAATESRIGAEAAATREAREVALKLKTERDEARALARQLHQKVAVAGGGAAREAADLRTALDHERQLAANLVSERDQLNLRIEALGRMIDQERDGRTRALSERDEWQSRFKALAKGSIDTPQPLDFSREETRSYAVPTVPEMPVVKGEAQTDPMIPKKKGP